MKRWKIVLLMVLYCLRVEGQVYPSKEMDLENFIESIFPIPDEDLNYEDLYESLYQYYLHPLDLNAATREELQSLFVLSELQINNFLKYREEVGPLLSIYELQSVPDWELRVIYKLLPFVIVKESSFIKSNKGLINRILSERNNYLLLRYERTLEEKKGYATSRYIGSPDKLYGKFRVSHARDFSLGFTFEKDAGEQLMWDPKTKRYGMDFLSGHLMVQNKGIVKSLIVGDYQLQAGQGLVLGSGFSMGKGSETITTVRRNNLGVRPYTSVLESGFLRGGAVTISEGNVSVTAFGSFKYVDGTLQSVDTIESSEDYISSFQYTGLHRTEVEIEKRKVIMEKSIGANLLYTSTNRKFNLGGNFINTDFSSRLQPSEKVYNQFEFRGKHNYNFGIFGDYNWQNFNFFAEAARSKSSGTGMVAGFLASISRNFELSMLYRSYDKSFHSFYGSAFGENSRNINESGFYSGIKINPINKVIFSAYFDAFQFPWLRYRVNAPSEGYECLSRITYQPHKKVEIYGQFREERKGANVSLEDSKIDIVEQGTKRNYIANVSYNPAGFLEMRSRIQYSTYKLEKNYTDGFAIIQDIGLAFKNLKVSGRYALFDTEDYINRQYVYEKNVLYAFSLPAYFGQGIRTFLLVQYKFNRKFTLWVKASQSRYIDRSKIGSGMEEIMGSKRTDFSCQIRYVL